MFRAKRVPSIIHSQIFQHPNIRRFSENSLPVLILGKELSEDIGEYLRVEVLKTLTPGMELTWLETQGPIVGGKVNL